MTGSADRDTIAVLGAGPAGCAAAIALARAGAPVLLFERSPHRRKPGEILSPSVRFALSELQLTEGFEARFPLRAQGCVSVWGGEPAAIDATLDPLGGEILVDRGELEAFLQSCAQKAGAQLVAAPQRLAAYPDTGGGNLRWRGEDGDHASRVRLIVEATGRGRGAVGRGGRHRYDQLVGVHGYVQTVGDSFGPHFLVEAAPSGWFYSAPLPGGGGVAALMTDTDLVPSGREAQQAHFAASLAQAPQTQARLGRHLGSAFEFVVAPAETSVRRVVAGASWIAIGDAAAAYDPIAGAGVAAALARGLALARLLSAEPEQSGALRHYVAAEAAALDDFQVQQRRIYRSEERWRNEPFWKRRAAHPDPALVLTFEP